MLFRSRFRSHAQRRSVALQQRSPAAPSLPSASGRDRAKTRRFHEPRTTRAPNPPAYATVHLRDSHALRSTIPNGSTPTTHTSHPPAEEKRSSPTTPHMQPLPSITHTRFSHHPLSLATTHRISFPTGTKMFHFPAFPPPPYTRSDETTDRKSVV